MTGEINAGTRPAGTGSWLSSLGKKAVWVLAACSLQAPAAQTNPPAATASKPECAFQYRRDEQPRVPWCIHVLKIDRSRADIDVQAVLGGGAVQGLSTVSQMMRMVPPEVGKPIGAINGDLFEVVPAYMGDPMGLHISNGELISSPIPSHSCFWMDAAGQLFLTNVAPRFQVTWPDGRSLGFGLNEARGRDEAVLYTAAVGASTRANGGRELVLERVGTEPWLPLRPGVTLQARVREVRNGDSPLNRDVMVLSIGPALASLAGATTNGTVLRISTATSPSLTGARTGMSGGPALVHNGKTKKWSAIQVRHPRTAVGWNATHLFFVVVDGRQRASVGMTFAELADYMLKLGCTDALNLDGGGSVTMWLVGNVVNSPSQGRERPAANALVLVQKPKPQK